MSELLRDENGRIIFTEKMKEEYTLFAPQMAPYHFEFFEDILKVEGYNVKVLKKDNHNLIHEGMKYVHNDTCVPALFVIGQFIDAIKTEGYDDKKVALIITQTGGGCRASNYIHLLRKALEKSGYPHIPVISLNVSKLEKNPGFKLSLNVGIKLLYAILLGDLFMQLVNEVKPYEINKGDATKVLSKWNSICRSEFKKKKTKWKTLKKLIVGIVADFDKVEVDKTNKKPRVGIVGEIYVKYSPLGNNNLEKLLEDEGCEIITPPLLDFFMFKLDYRAYEVDLYGGSKSKKIAVNFVMKFLEKKRNFIRTTLEGTKFHKPVLFDNLKSLVDGYSDRGNRMGEGWLLTAEMIELIKMGVPNIVCTQPFGCLPNHISGKGMMKIIKQNFPESNIIPIDYDTSASEINQINRIKLMVANAYRNLEK